ncbi:MAG: PQQ-dependent sugar dehydrogenase [Xanthomonadales bacterium]|nr:PQQ-dependent sugar dehydrogenase [Gammaproteobacteria bacterium]MBT8054890.1 PQQ-dependent sugar dehydrogenase [Gammaproteobacteria bacterium]NND58179.1 PQQ-dependent sugar dehydrogenase [Xanthomonadales bacterium]NNK50036.1 PQQ-dependent sugar dehydrogenase [Xanthomonadales bacterium]
MKFRTCVFPSIIALIAIFMTLGVQAQETRYSAYHDYRTVTVAEGLVRPWSLAFLPGGEILVTEKPGRLRIIRDGVLVEQPVSGLPEIFAEGQGGLLDVVPHPEYASNGLIYLSYSKPLENDESTTAVVRGRLEGDRLTGLEQVFEAQTRGRGHYGCRLAFDGQGHLFITIGDRQASPSGDLESHPAQDLANHHGVVVRLNEDGSVPDDNPFVGQEGALPEIWSYGHRNAQGMVIDRENGHVWITEHGPQGGDELDLIEPGANYGWPVIGYGVNYRSGSAIHQATHRDGMVQPEKIWVPSIGVSGLALYNGDAFPHWRGHLLAGGLSGQRITLLELDGREVVREETLVQGIGRVRDVRVGPDGFIYIAIDGRDGNETPIVRLEPVERRELAQ